VFGHAASGAGNPLLFNQNSHQSALRPQDVLIHYEYLANKGDVSAQHVFGQLLYVGTVNLPVNYARAFTYFYKAAQQFPTGANAAALKDPKSAEYKKLPKSVIANAKASADSASLLGKMYWRGEGVKRSDPATARQWFERGVEWNSAGSQAALGYMIQHGEAGFTKDSKRAKELYTLAAAKNDVDGQTWLGEIWYSMGDYANALKYFTLASRQVCRS
jgi:TPR repeat protein